MEHLTKKGESKIVERCTYPLTGARCVDRIYTDLAVIDVKPDGLHVVDIVEGLDFHELQRLTGIPLKFQVTARAA
jgi:3-oxoadipate CoA-transferase beta subunit